MPENVSRTFLYIELQNMLEPSVMPIVQIVARYKHVTDETFTHQMNQLLGMALSRHLQPEDLDQRGADRWAKPALRNTKCRMFNG